MMKGLLKRGELKDYRKTTLKEAYESISIRECNYSRNIIVFISHKHDELDDVKDVVGFLESKYNVKCYIDSEDGTMPIFTSGETAVKIKQRIRQCDKFILLATNGAINSKWCNWELGFGDAYKFKDNIAIFPFEDEGVRFEGSEYLKIYPYIEKRESGDKYKDGSPITPGYYVRSYLGNDSWTIMELGKWLNRK